MSHVIHEKNYYTSGTKKVQPIEKAKRYCQTKETYKKEIKNKQRFLNACKKSQITLLEKEA
jgi:hypothetical protein